MPCGGCRCVLASPRCSAADHRRAARRGRRDQPRRRAHPQASTPTCGPARARQRRPAEPVHRLPRPGDRRTRLRPHRRREVPEAVRPTRSAGSTATATQAGLRQPACRAPITDSDETRAELDDGAGAAREVARRGRPRPDRAEVKAGQRGAAVSAVRPRGKADFDEMRNAVQGPARRPARPGRDAGERPGRRGQPAGLLRPRGGRRRTARRASSSPAGCCGAGCCSPPCSLQRQLRHGRRRRLRPSIIAQRAARAGSRRRRRRAHARAHRHRARPLAAGHRGALPERPGRHRPARGARRDADAVPAGARAARRAQRRRRHPRGRLVRRDCRCPTAVRLSSSPTSRATAPQPVWSRCGSSWR